MPTTANRDLNIPNNGDNPGTWNEPINANFTAIDSLFGAVTTVALSSTNVTLSTSQCKNAVIRLTGILAADVAVIFPTVSAIYTVENLTTNSVGFNYTVTCRMAAGNAISIPQGIPTQIFTDGTNTKFWNVPIPGTYWDYAGSSVPTWVTACTVRPWLVCDGTVYNIADYPYLGRILGSTWGGNGTTTFAVPDLRNRVRAPIMTATPRITAAGSGVNGSTLGAVGGTETNTLVRANLPNENVTTTSNGNHTHRVWASNSEIGSAYGWRSNSSRSVAAVDNASSSYVRDLRANNSEIQGIEDAGDHTHQVNLNGNVTQTAFSNIPPIAISGITLIKT